MPGLTLASTTFQPFITGYVVQKSFAYQCMDGGVHGTDMLQAEMIGVQAGSLAQATCRLMCAAHAGASNPICRPHGAPDARPKPGSLPGCPCCSACC